MRLINDSQDLDFRKLLQGRYEAERLPDNLSSVSFMPDFAYNVLNPLGILYRPVVDENYLAEGGTKPIWSEGRPFAVCLTHDVDTVSLNSFRRLARLRTRNLMNGATKIMRISNFLGRGLDILRTIKSFTAQDPLHTYESWLEVENNVGARSTFFFWPGWKAVGKRHSSDCTYDLTDKIVFDKQKCTVAEMIREIDRRGWEIGLHPSWYSFDDVDEMKRQKSALENTLGHDVVSARQHYLHYDIRITPRVQSEAGLLYDSTLGFNNNIGFRFGSSYPWQLYDLRAEKQLSVWEIPLIIQDGALFNPLRGMFLNEDTAFLYVKMIAESVENVGGILTLLWHPNIIINQPAWNLYSRVLNYLKDRNACFLCVRDVVKQFISPNLP